MSILNADKKKMANRGSRGNPKQIRCCCHTTVVYKFKCDLYDAGYVGFTRRHLHQRVQEHKKSTSLIGEHFRNKRSLALRDLK